MAGHREKKESARRKQAITLFGGIQAGLTALYLLIHWSRGGPSLTALLGLALAEAVMGAAAWFCILAKTNGLTNETALDVYGLLALTLFGASFTAWAWWLLVALPGAYVGYNVWTNKRKAADMALIMEAMKDHKDEATLKEEKAAAKKARHEELARKRGGYTVTKKVPAQ